MGWVSFLAPWAIQGTPPPPKVKGAHPASAFHFAQGPLLSDSTQQRGRRARWAAAGVGVRFQPAGGCGRLREGTAGRPASPQPESPAPSPAPAYCWLRSDFRFSISSQHRSFLLPGGFPESTWGRLFWASRSLPPRAPALLFWEVFQSLTLPPAPVHLVRAGSGCSPESAGLKVWGCLYYKCNIALRLFFL